jgi:hypothetical protein
MVTMVGSLARQNRPWIGGSPQSALKEFIDLQERRVSAFETFVPEAVLYVLAIAALGGAFVARSRAAP